VSIWSFVVIGELLTEDEIEVDDDKDEEIFSSESCLVFR
jgi:hypothetical protein